MAENGLLTLYNTLSNDPDLSSKDDNNFGTFEEFSAAMEHPENIKSVYDYMQGKENIGTLEDFSASLRNVGDEVKVPEYDKGKQERGDSTPVSPTDPYVEYGGVDEPLADYSAFNDVELSKKKAQAEEQVNDAMANGNEEELLAAAGDLTDADAELQVRSEDPSFIDLSKATDSQLDQYSNDNVLAEAENIADPTERSAAINYYLAAKTEKSKRNEAKEKSAKIVADTNDDATAAAVAARAAKLADAATVHPADADVDTIKARREIAAAENEINREQLTRGNKALENYNALTKPFAGPDGQLTSIAEQAINRNPDKYNEYIPKFRGYTTDQLWETFADVMNSATRSEHERALIGAVLMGEITARQKGGHLKTFGEQNAEK